MAVLQLDDVWVLKLLQNLYLLLQLLKLPLVLAPTINDLCTSSQ